MKFFFLLKLKICLKFLIFQNAASFKWSRRRFANSLIEKLSFLVFARCVQALNRLETASDVSECQDLIMDHGEITYIP